MKEYLQNRRAKDFMIKEVIALKPETTVREIYQLFVKNDIMGAPVIDKEKSVIGMVTERDLAIREEDLEVPPSLNLLGSVIYLGDIGKFEENMKKKLGQLAQDIMTSPALVLHEEASLQEVLNFMDAHKINRVPVVDKNEKLVGIITRTDILKELVREGKNL